MKLDANPQAHPLKTEELICERLAKLNKRHDKPPVDVFAIVNLNGEQRLRITTHTEAESSNTYTLFENLKFKDMGQLDKIEDEGCVEFGIDEDAIANFPAGIDVMLRET